MRIGIVKLSSLGDIVHAMIVLQFIKEHNQEIMIDWFVEEDYHELLSSNPYINNIHIVKIKRAKKKKSLFMLLRELNKVRKFESYDLVIDMQGLIKSAIISKLIPSSKTIGFDRFSIREKMASIFYNETFNFAYEANIIERNIAIIKFALGIKISKEQIDDKEPFFQIGASKNNIRFSNSKKNILLIPGASNPSKRFPVYKLSELSNSVDGKFFIIWSSPEEKILAEEVKSLSPKVNICDKLSIESLIFLISKVDLVIGPDTGPTHLGWGLNIPSITLFGSTPGSRNSYPTEINKIIEAKKNINPRQIDKADFSIRKIKVTDVVKMTNNLLDI
jgi:heptosyltransferase I